MAHSSAALRQAAAIPVRSGRVCLVLSSGGKRWVVPKGRIEQGQTAGETALQEAWEEAGLVGSLLPQPVGSYRYRKCGIVHHVTVFLMNVTEVTDDWPESSLRLRRWLRPESALARIEEPSLRKLLGKVLKMEALETSTSPVE
jgi:8-oxo-dGTP pyrophosphatase MutT (NUDIX family)